MLAIPSGWLYRRYRKGCATWLPSVLPLYHLSIDNKESDRYYHIWDVWQHAQWCVAKDVAAYVGISRSTIDSWRKRGVIRTCRSQFRRSRLCVHYEDVIRLDYYYRVTKLLKMGRGINWEVVEGYSKLPVEAVKQLAAERARTGAK